MKWNTTKIHFIEAGPCLFDFEYFSSPDIHCIVSAIIVGPILSRSISILNAKFHVLKLPGVQVHYTNKGIILALCGQISKRFYVLAYQIIVGRPIRGGISKTDFFFESQIGNCDPEVQFVV
jgi:hypothetical protein